MNDAKENKIILKNAVLSLGIKGIDYILSFVSIPILLGCLGDYKYGVYASTLSIISWIYYFDLGIGNGMRNRVTEACTNNDLDTVQKNISVAYFWVSIISCLFVLVSYIIYKFINLSSVLNVYIEDENLNLIVYLAIILAAINFVLQLSSSVLLAIKKTALNNAFGITSKMVLLVALIGFRFFKIDCLIYVVVVEGLAQLAKNTFATIYLYYLDKRFFFSRKKIDLSYSKGILGFGILIFAMQMSSLVLNSTDNILIQKLYNSAEVTPYNLCYKYFSIINALFSVAITPLWSSYTTAYVQRNIKFIKNTMRKSLLLYGITLIGIVCATIIYIPFMRIYLGKEIAFPKPLPFLMATYFAILILSHTFSTFVHAISKVKLTTIACMVSAISNIPFSIFFATNEGMGISGVILGSIASICFPTITYCYIACKEVKKMSLQWEISKT